jgi:hypothetical protein
MEAALENTADDADSGTAAAEPETGQAAADSDEAAASPGTTSEGDAATGEADEQAGTLPELEGVDPETLTPELRAVYDRLVQERTAQQADYTRKTQALAEQRRAAESQTSALEQQVANMQAQLAAFATQQQVPDPTQGPADDSFLYAGLGDRIDPTAAMEDPQLFLRYQQQVATVEARRAAFEVASVFGGQIGALTQQLEAQAAERAVTEVETFMGANADLEPYREQMAHFIGTGAAATLDDAAALVRASAFSHQREAEALALGAEMERKRAAAVQAAQDQFNVPSASTGSGDGPKFTKDMSLHDVMLAAAADLPE